MEVYNLCAVNLMGERLPTRLLNKNRFILLDREAVQKLKNLLFG